MAASFMILSGPMRKYYRRNMTICVAKLLGGNLGRGHRSCHSEEQVFTEDHEHMFSKCFGRGSCSCLSSCLYNQRHTD